jgi:type IV secretory pathway TrbD component
MIITVAKKEPIAGYEAPILRGVWERATRMGAPRIIAAVWLVLWLWIALLVMTIVGFKLALVPLVIWALGQGVLVLLTVWDPFWDDLFLMHLVRRYKPYYGV